MKAAALLASLALSACCTIPAPPVTVKVPVPVPCLDAPMPAPKWTPNAELIAMSAGDFVVTLAADRAELIAWSDEALAVMQGCIRR